jgi:hypothetical protein
MGIAERTLEAVFKKSGVKDALGNSPALVRKHYGKWSKGRQDNIDRLMMAHFQSESVTVKSQKCHTKKRGP